MTLGAQWAKEFHVDGIPTTFVYDRDGELVAKAIDMRTQRQFFSMLAFAGLQPLAAMRPAGEVLRAGRE